MKIEIELKEAELAQVMYSLGKAVAILEEADTDSNHYVASSTLRCLGGLILRGCEGSKTTGSVVLLYDSLGGGSSRL